MKRHTLSLFVLAALSSSCGNVDFPLASELQTVRMLAARADKPYAAPGETVQLEMLTHDGRGDKTRPMKLYWIPIVCTNPRNDLYYACFQQFAGAQVPGTGGGGGVTLTPGVDLSPYLPTGSTYSITLPQDIVTAHERVEGTTPYGLAIVFSVLCAGHVELVQRTSDNPQAVPFGCFDDAGNQLGPEEYVIGFTRVYGYDTRRNANPLIDKVLIHDRDVVKEVNEAEGIIVDRCTSELRRDCPDIKLDVRVAESNHEVQEGTSDPEGRVRKEQIWAAYFSEVGQFDSETRLIYDVFSGKVPESENKYKASNVVGDSVMYIVLHDNRGGASWKTITVHTREPPPPAP